MRFTLALLFSFSLASAQSARTLLFVNQTYLSRPYIAKELQKSCPAVVITQDKDRAQFRMDHDFGLHRIGNDIALYDKSGALITTVSARRPNNAIKNLCAAIETAAAH